MKKAEFSSFLANIPKAEIHIHIEAVMSIASVRKLYEQKHGKKMSKDAESSLFSYSDLNGFINAFLTVQDLFQSVQDFKYVFDDLGKYLSKNNIVYCEAFFAPSAFVKKGFDYGEMVKLFSSKIAQIKEKYGITIKLILDVSRTFGCDNAMKNYELLKEHPCDDIIGIGLGGAEQKGPAKEFEPVFKRALADGFHAVAHAGEDVGPESIWDSIKLLNAQRIGHGISCVQDQALVDYLAKSQLPLEVCITSNVFTKHYVKKTSEHPIREMFDKSIFVTVNTDDPVFFKTTLIEEYWKCFSELNFTLPEIKKLICNAFNATFLSDAQKKKYIQQVNAAWKENLPK
ncbi:MAG: adenosine deaminase [Treponema sp.]|nr:adenosine deaminase [Treponema sp.]